MFEILIFKICTYLSCRLSQLCTKYLIKQRQASANLAEVSNQENLVRYLSQKILPQLGPNLSFLRK